MAANDRFDKEAAEWDNNPFTVRSSQFALGALLENIPQLQAATAESGEKSECRPFLLKDYFFNSQRWVETCAICILVHCFLTCTLFTRCFVVLNCVRGYLCRHSSKH